MKKILTILVFLLPYLVSGQNYFWSYNGTITPVVTTQAVTNIGATTATGNGTVVQPGNPRISERGSCWNTSINPTVSNSRTSDGSTVGAFTSALSSLTYGTTYYVRAYVITVVGNYYGDNVSFEAGTIPTVTTTAITGLTEVAATSGGNVTSAGGGTVSARGVCWNTGGTPTTADSKTTDGTGTGSYVSSITGLSEGTTYYVRAYATNSKGTAYGSQRSLTTGASIPGNGKLYNWYAATDAKNIANTGWHTPTFVELDSLRHRLDPAGSQSSNVAGNKMKATGTTYWNAPNSDATNSSGFNGRGSGLRLYNGNFAAIKAGIYFNSSTSYNTNTAYGGFLYDGSAYFWTSSSQVYYKAEGASIRLICDSSTDPGSYTGNDGKTYSTVKIGNQVWISSNLRETKYRDGTDIIEVTSATAWAALTTGAFCWYNNNANYE